MMKKKDLLEMLLGIILSIALPFTMLLAGEKSAEETYNIYDREDFYSTYESAWQQVEKDFPEARDVIYYSCLDNYYMNDKNDYFVVVRKFTVYYNTKHVDNYEYKLVMYDSDIIMSEYWEV